MHALQARTQQSAASRSSHVQLFRPCLALRRTIARAPVRPVAVDRLFHVEAVARPTSASPFVEKAAAGPHRGLKQRVVEWAQTGAKAVAILGVAVALVSCGCM